MSGKIIQKSILGLSLLFLFGCQQTESPKDADFVIFNQQKSLAFSFYGDTLKEIGEATELKDGRVPRWDYVKETDEAVYGKTTETSHPGSPLIYRYDKTKHSFKTIDDGDAYAMGFDGEFLYRTDVFTDKVVFYKHDELLKEVLKKEFSAETALTLTNGILPIGDKLYVLIGSVDKDSGQHENRLWILDKNLNKLEDIAIDYTDQDRGGFLRMVNVGHKLYIVESSRGLRDDGEPGPGNTIVTYDIESRELGQIKVDTPYPHDIFYDEERNLLVIYHYTLYVKDAKWTFVNLDDNSQRTISLAEGFDQDASFTQHNGDYYFLFKNKLVKYNYDNDKKTEYDLKQYGIENASVLVFEK
jgi:hypothetical protein